MSTDIKVFEEHSGSIIVKYSVYYDSASDCVAVYTNGRRAFAGEACAVYEELLKRLGISIKNANPNDLWLDEGNSYECVEDERMVNPDTKAAALRDKRIDELKKELDHLLAERNAEHVAERNAEHGRYPL